MKKRNKIIYWIATIWLSVAMLASGIQQLFNIGGFSPIMQKLGYPAYFSIILGLWKIAGTAILLLPGTKLWKEWAYAGFFFAMSGAFFSHLAVGEGAAELFAPAFLLLLTIASWYFRPADRKLSEPGQ